MTDAERAAILEARDLAALERLLADDPSAAVRDLRGLCDHPRGAAPLNFLAMLRCDNDRGVWRNVDATGPLAEALLAAGAPVDGRAEESETPLMTAASYGDAEIARVLVAAGADLERRSTPDAGGVPEATALAHAAVFGMTAVLDVLVATGARAEGVAYAAAAGDVSRELTADTPLDDRLRALAMAADHERLAVIDALLEAGTPIDGEEPRWGRQALRIAASGGRVGSVRHLLERGADPAHRDPGEGLTALEWCRREAPRREDAEHAEVERILAAVA